MVSLTTHDQTSASNVTTSPMNATEANSSKFVSVVVGHPYGYYGPGPHYGNCGEWGFGGYGWRRRLKKDRNDEKEEEDEQKARPEGAAQKQSTPSSQSATCNATRRRSAAHQPDCECHACRRARGRAEYSVRVDQSDEASGAKDHWDDDDWDDDDDRRRYRYFDPCGYRHHCD